MTPLYRNFQSIEVTAGDFCGVAGTPAAGRGWGCVIRVISCSLISWVVSLGGEFVASHT